MEILEIIFGIAQVGLALIALFLTWQQIRDGKHFRMKLRTCVYDVNNGGEIYVIECREWYSLFWKPVVAQDNSDGKRYTFVYDNSEDAEAAYITLYKEINK